MDWRKRELKVRGVWLVKGRAGALQKEAGERRERVIKYMSESEWNETKEEVDLLLVVL